ncbi:MAG: hypothetical protein ACREK2_10420 [Gemmatimonadota bacterium]
MRATIAGFLTATLYTLAVAALIGESMPTQEQLRTSIEASYLAAASAELTQAIEAQPSQSAAIE